MRELQAGSSYLSQNYLEASFGLGTAAVIDEVRVRWVCGATEVFTGVEPGSYWRLLEGNGAATHVSVALSGLDVHPLAGGIQLEWNVSAWSRIVATHIERAPADRIDALSRVELAVTYERGSGRAFDADVQRGERYAYRIEIETVEGERVRSGLVFASAGGASVPALAPRVGQNYPNPFNPSTTILVELPRTTEMRLVLYDERGRQVRELYAGTLGPGTHPVDWNGEDGEGRPVASGTYRYVLITPERTSSRSLSLVR
jgi:hypothetical protein